MREIGGYIGLDSYGLPLLHEAALGLNSGRSALAYLLRARGIGRLWIPKLICDAVTGVCAREGVPCSFYGVGADFLPEGDIPLGENEWLYVVNFYSQLDNGQIAAYAEKYGRVIADNAQSYFQAPLPGVDTLYTCRKYFGVPDGAFLYTDAVLDGELPQDESFDRMGFLLGRFERSAEEFYAAFEANEGRFADEPIKRMSGLTRNLLRGIDYPAVRRRRRENFEALHERLVDRNLLHLSRTGSFMYPLLIKNGAELREKLRAEKIYIPTLWPNVSESCGPEEPERAMAENILPLPIDQRYDPADMAYIAGRIEALL